MFGTLGFSELIIILAIVLIIFGAGRLPQIGEGIGKALKGFKKEVREEPPPVDQNASPQAAAVTTATQPLEDAHVVGQAGGQPQSASAAAPSTPRAPYQPGPEATPGTTAALTAAGSGPQAYQPPRPKVAQPAPAAATTAQAAQPASQTPQPMTMEERMAQAPPAPRAAYPALPPTAQARPGAKRPSAIVNKQAVARVQAQQAALKEKAAQSTGPSPQDMQSLGESVGDALRTFRQAVADVRNSVDPEMRTIQAEMEAAEKELQQSIEAARQMPAVQEDPPKTS